jgi:hypothetical protein
MVTGRGGWREGGLDGGRSTVGKEVVGTHWDYVTCSLCPALMKWVLLGQV